MSTASGSKDPMPAVEEIISPKKFVIKSQGGKKNCHLGPALPVALVTLIAAFGLYVDSCENENLFMMGSYMTMERQNAACIKSLLGIKDLLLCLIRATSVVRFVGSQLRKALLKLIEDDRWKDRRSFIKTCKYPDKTWAKVLTGAIVVALAHVRNLGLRTYRHPN